MERKRKDDSSGENSRAVESIAARALKSAQSYVAGSPGTGRTGDAGGKAFSNSYRAFLEWGEERKLIRDESAFDFFKCRPDGYGDEHEAWFDEPSNRWFKATYPNRFGLSWFGDESATVREYLTRLTLQNTYFADDVELVAIANCKGRIRVITSQRHIGGDPAAYNEICGWFEEIGYRCIRSDGMIAWYNKSVNVLVADAHEGNVIKTTFGILVPIDLNIIQPDGPLLEWALKGSPN